MNRKEFLDDTIKYYSEDVSRRAVVDGVGKYLLPDGRRCAIGRWIKGECYDPTIERMSISIIFMSMLQNEISQLGVEFLASVQALHDADEYWCVGKGLSSEGEKFVEWIKMKYTHEAS